MGWLDTASASGDTYLGDTVRLLWPPPTRLSTSRRPDPATGECRGYLLIPSARRPKVLVPANGPAAAAAIRGFKTTQARREATVLAMLAAGLRVGAGAVLSDRLHVSAAAGADDIESHLARVLRRSVRIALHISPPRAVRKPVLQLIDGGRTFGFAKLGIDEFTSTLVRGEGANVQRLAAISWRTLRVPEVLHVGTWHDRPLLVQAALQRGAEPAPTAVGAAMDELARAQGTSILPLSASPYWARLCERVDKLPQSPLRAALNASLRELADQHRDTVVEFGAWHGDWTSWNMNAADGRVQVWDWEKLEYGVPIGFDAAHCFIQRAVIRVGRQPVDAFADLIARAEPLRGAHGLDTAAGRRVCWLYAMHLAVSYLEDDESTLGDAPLTRLHSWLPQALQRAAAAVGVRSPT